LSATRILWNVSPAFNQALVNPRERGRPVSANPKVHNGLPLEEFEPVLTLDAFDG